MSMRFLSCPIPTELFELIENLANDDDGSLRCTLTGNREALVTLLGCDADQYLPDDWSLPAKEECVTFCNRYQSEGRGQTYGENIMHFSQEVRDKWVCADD